MTILLELSDLSIVIMSNDAFSKTVFLFFFFFFCFRIKRGPFFPESMEKKIYRQKNVIFLLYRFVRGLLKRNDIRTYVPSLLLLSFFRTLQLLGDKIGCLRFLHGISNRRFSSPLITFSTKL